MLQFPQFIFYSGNNLFQYGSFHCLYIYTVDVNQEHLSSGGTNALLAIILSDFYIYTGLIWIDEQPEMVNVLNRRIFYD